MANDIRQFSLSVEQFSKKLGIAVVTAQKKIAFDLYGRIITKTPVDTGRARGSWTIAINQPDRSILPPGHYGPPKVPTISVQPGQAIWISNNVPYITALEHGHSTQAPNGMVALSVEETKAEMAAIERASAREAGL